MAPRKHELIGQLTAARLQNEMLATQRDNAQRRAELALAIITRAPGNLKQLFGPLTEFGPDEDCTVLRFESTDGIAIVQLNPATGALHMSDPHRVVADQVVYFDTYGQLDDSQIATIRRFRNDVKISRMPEDVDEVYGPVSLTASVSVGVTDTSAGSTELTLTGDHQH